MFLLRKNVVRIKECETTYKWCMQSCFEGQIGCNLEVYVDDIIVKIR
jgi:hypothetical protein